MKILYKAENAWKSGLSSLTTVWLLCLGKSNNYLIHDSFLKFKKPTLLPLWECYLAFSLYNSNLRALEATVQLIHNHHKIIILYPLVNMVVKVVNQWLSLFVTQTHNVKCKLGLFKYAAISSYTFKPQRVQKSSFFFSVFIDGEPKQGDNYASFKPRTEKFPQLWMYQPSQSQKPIRAQPA